MTDVSGTLEVDGACALPHPRLPLLGDDGSTFFGQFRHAPGLIEGWLAWYQPLMVGGVVPTRTKELCRLAVASRTLFMTMRIPQVLSSRHSRQRI